MHTFLFSLAGCELRSHEEDEVGNAVDDLVYTPTVDSNQCSCNGIPEPAEDEDDESTMIATKGGTKTKGKSSGFALNALANAGRLKGVYIVGAMSALGTMLAVFAGVAYQRKTSASVSRLIQEVAYLRQTTGETGNACEEAHAEYDDGTNEISVVNTVHEELFREFEVAKASLHTQGKGGSGGLVQEAGVLLD